VGLNNATLSSFIFSPQHTEYLNDFIEETKDFEGDVAIVHDESFIAYRMAGPLVGPLAVFSRYNLSLTMTRSIGDR